MNTAVDEIRQNLRLKTFQDTVSSFESAPRKNHAHLMQYVAGLWRRHPALYVVRLDVGWPVPPPTLSSLFDSRLVLPVEQHKAFGRFRTGAPRRLAKTVPASRWLGYVWKIDHPGMQIARQERPLPYMHLFIFFNQASQHHRESIIQCLTDTWRQVTHKVGVYHDWTAPGISGRGAAGTGVFHRTQPEQAKALRQALLMMTKADYLARYKFPLFPEFRTFGKGQLPKRKRTTRE